MEYFPRIEDVADKVLWGTDWPGPGVPEIKGNIEKFNALPIGAAASGKILYDNAARLFPRLIELVHGFQIVKHDFTL